MTDLSKIYPCGRIARRRFLYQSAAGFLGTAIGSLWADEGNMAAARLPGEPKAKSVIYLFMCGGASCDAGWEPGPAASFIISKGIPDDVHAELSAVSLQPPAQETTDPTRS